VASDGERPRGVFISSSERQKDALARPFKELLAQDGIRGFIVSDEPRTERAWTPEEKVDAYLDLSDAVVVFATGDLEAGGDRYTRPNIGDEIGRARSKPHLRDRVCVLKEHGVTLPSNIDPAYESFDPAEPVEGFRRGLIQLREWGFPIEHLPDVPPPDARRGGPSRSARPAHDAPVRYARTTDGVTIAYTETGTETEPGRALVVLPTVPFSDVLAQWRIPSVRTAYERLAQDLRLVLYDGRGTGQSQRDVTDLGLEPMIRDLDAVIEHVGIERFALLGSYGAALVALAYAARHSDRVTHLILFAGALSGQELITGTDNESLVTLVEGDWDFFVDSAARAWMGWSMGKEAHAVADYFRSATTPAVWRAAVEAAREIDVSGVVGSVKAPALVLHRQGERERQIPLDVSRRLAAALPNGRLLPLEGSAASLFYEDPQGDVETILSFLAEDPK
jgi:pimeloyl-ACP methyl ester carboxylesterase